MTDKSKDSMLLALTCAILACVADNGSVVAVAWFWFFLYSITASIQTYVEIFKTKEGDNT